MVRRYLDVLLERLRVFALAAVVLPVVLAAGSFLLDRSHLVTARLWAEPPTYALDLAAFGGFPGTPPKSEATLLAGRLQQLIATDSFVDRVLDGAKPPVQARGAGRSATRLDFRKALTITANRGHLVVFTYRTDQPERGVTVLNSLISVFGESASVVIEQPPGGAAGAALQDLRTVMEQSYGSLAKGGSVAAGVGPTPGLTRLSAVISDANARAADYRRQLAGLVAAEQPDLGSVTIPALRPAVFQVIDPPLANPRSSGSLVRPFLLALGGTVAAELMLIYLIGLHDPRIRAGGDVEMRTGIRYLGGTSLLRPGRT